MAFRHRMGAILFLSCCVFFAIGCENDEVAIYEVKLKMMWSDDRLPMDYSNPYGDIAHWSPVFGQSHNRSYILYSVGEVAQPALQHLLQSGVIDDLMLQGEEEPKVFDQFSAPAVGSGVGETQGLVVVDGEHSLVSLISRMMPTPDWFVGVDSLNLCIDSSWVDQITLDLEPLSGGTSKKAYFNDVKDYLHSPSGPVTKLGAKAFNDHFHYKAPRELLTIAKAEFTKKEVYSSEEINKLIRNDVIARLTQKDQQKERTETPGRRFDYRSEDDEEDLGTFSDATTKNYVEHLKELEEEPFGTPAPDLPENNVVIVTKAPSFRSPEDDEIGDVHLGMDDAVLAVARGRKLGLNKHLPRHFRSRLHHAVNHRPRRH